MNFSSVLKSGRDKLLSSGIENCKREAEELLSFVTGKSLSTIRFSGNNLLEPEKVEKFNRLIKKRCNGYPLQYILGEWSFYNLDHLSVGEGVLIPRPETELIVDRALEFLSKKRDKGTIEVFDLCSGSGCIAISVALNAPWCHVTAVEYSDDALFYLKKNVEKYNLENLTVKKWNLFDGPYMNMDLLLSNPPYIKTEDINGLQSEVHYEPEMALDGGEDGLVFYRAIKEKWFERLNPGGLAVMEIGEDQGEEIEELFKSVSSSTLVRKDYSGLDRIVEAYRPV